MSMRLIATTLAVSALVGFTGLACAAPLTVTNPSSSSWADPGGSGRIVPVQLSQGQGKLDFSNGTGVWGGVPTRTVEAAVGGFNVLSAKVSPVGASAVNIAINPVGSRIQYPTRTNIEFEANLKALTLDDQTGGVIAARLEGGMKISNPYIAGVADGGELTITKLHVDFGTNTVYANLAGRQLLYDGSTDTEYLGDERVADLALWTFATDSVPQVPTETIFTAGSFSGQVELSTLRWTESSLEFVAWTLGLMEGGTGNYVVYGMNNAADGLGRLRINYTITAVPEPSVLLLCGAAFIVLAGVGRARV